MIPAGTVIRPEPLRAAVLEDRIQPLSRSLALALLDRCALSGFRRIEARIVDRAPESLDSLLESWPGEPEPVPVSGEHAEGTIWGHPGINALYRAWHDTLHVLRCAQFDLRGEIDVALAESRLCDAAGDRAIMRAEGAGQALFHAKHGRFPDLQRPFVVYAVRFGLARAITDGARFLKEGRP